MTDAHGEHVWATDPIEPERQPVIQVEPVPETLIAAIARALAREDCYPDDRPIGSRYQRHARAALAAINAESWLVLRVDQPAFTCPRCRHTSYHPKDVEVGYCGYCRDWTGERGW